MDAWMMLTAERQELADFCATLTPEQWDAPTLCDEWKVRDAVGHVLYGMTVTKGAFFMSFVKNGFNFNKGANREAKAIGARPPADLVRELRAHVADRTLPPLLKPVNLLGDAVVHQQDCRRPLGMPREIPPERLRAALDAMKVVQPVLANRDRIRGVKLVATDFDWAHGAGPEIRGPGEALLMVMNGRGAALVDVDGPGVAVLSARLSKEPEAPANAGPPEPAT